MSEPNLIALAQKGDPDAIAALINRQIQPKGITAKLTLKDDCLHIRLDAEKAPSQPALVTFILKGLKGLGAQSIQQAKVYGWAAGEDFPAWQEELNLSESALADLAVSTEAPRAESNSSIELNSSDVDAVGSSSEDAEANNEDFRAKSPFRWNSVFHTVTNVAGTVANKGGRAVATTVTGTAGVVGTAAHQSGRVMVSVTTGTAGAVGNAAKAGGSAIAGKTVNMASAIGSAALRATDGLGYVLDLASQSPQLQELTKALRVDWLLPIIDQVDIVKAETHVKRLQKKFPNDGPRAIAHRLMMEKVLYVGGSGVASSLLPGFAAAMFAVDLAATTAIQAELGYQIACAYGLDLHEPARKGEVLALFGLAFGGGYALKAGLGMMRNLPVAGAAVGASTNAVALYTIGYAACHFYETKVSPLVSEAAAEDSQAESDAYLREAIAQQIVMDQILAHVVLAGNPGKTWDQILPELKVLNLSPASLEVMSKNVGVLPALDQLLTQVNQDFAVPLLAQCEKIVQLDGIITPEEAQVIETITQQLTAKPSSSADAESTQAASQNIMKGLFRFRKKSQ